MSDAYCLCCRGYHAKPNLLWNGAFLYTAATFSRLLWQYRDNENLFQPVLCDKHSPGEMDQGLTFLIFPIEENRPNIKFPHS